MKAMNLKNKMNTMTRALGVLGVVVATLGASGCAIHSTDKYGNDCIVGQTCPGLLVRPIKNTVIEGMKVTGVHEPGSKVWNNAIRTDALALKMTEDAVRAHVGNKDFVQARKMGFLFAVNKFGGLYTEGLAVGDMVDLAVTENPLDNHIVRIVKRAGE